MQEEWRREEGGERGESAAAASPSAGTYPQAPPPPASPPLRECLPHATQSPACRRMIRCTLHTSQLPGKMKLLQTTEQRWHLLAQTCSGLKHECLSMIALFSNSQYSPLKACLVLAAPNFRLTKRRLCSKPAAAEASLASTTRPSHRCLGRFAAVTCVKGDFRSLSMRCGFRSRPVRAEEGLRGKRAAAAPLQQARHHYPLPSCCRLRVSFSGVAEVGHPHMRRALS